MNWKLIGLIVGVLVVGAVVFFVIKNGKKEEKPKITGTAEIVPDETN